LRLQTECLKDTFEFKHIMFKIVGLLFEIQTRYFDVHLYLEVLMRYSLTVVSL